MSDPIDTGAEALRALTARWDLADETGNLVVHVGRDLALALEALAAEKERVAATADEGLRERVAATLRCPYPAKGRPNDDTASACFAAGVCGCDSSDTIDRIISAIDLPGLLSAAEQRGREAERARWQAVYGGGL